MQRSLQGSVDFHVSPPPSRHHLLAHDNNGYVKIQLRHVRAYVIQVSAVRCFDQGYMAGYAYGTEQAKRAHHSVSAVLLVSQSSLLTASLCRTDLILGV